MYIETDFDTEKPTKVLYSDQELLDRINTTGIFQSQFDYLGMNDKHLRIFLRKEINKATKQDNNKMIVRLRDLQIALKRRSYENVIRLSIIQNKIIIAIYPDILDYARIFGAVNRIYDRWTQGYAGSDQAYKDYIYKLVKRDRRIK